jgi:hypothetical protein
MRTAAITVFRGPEMQNKTKLLVGVTPVLKKPLVDKLPITELVQLTLIITFISVAFWKDDSIQHMKITTRANARGCHDKPAIS